MTAGPTRKLIHFPVDKLAPKGGPAGYLYNLKHGLEELGDAEFDFLPVEGSSYEQNATLQKLVPSRIKDLRRLRNFLALLSREVAAPVDYSQYGAVHFHSTEDLYLHRKALETYRGKVVLTSHSPCVYHEELIARLNSKDAEAHAEELKGLAVIDEYSFKRADYVIFPCPEAEEPYFHTWDGYEAVRDRSKLRYVPTGIEPVSAKVERSELRKRYGIPEDAFVVCYVGRHNKIKGYDLLQKAARELLDDEDIWFLVAGREGPIYGLEHSRWVEVGWTDDPHSVIAAADTFILPNRETFFDLIMLEVLSLGQVVLASRTGGNNFFEKFGCEGIRLYDEVDELVELVRVAKASSAEERQAWRAAARALYEREFTVDVFARRYASVMREICGD